MTAKFFVTSLCRLSLDAAVSIYSQEATRRVRALSSSHRRAAWSYGERYARGEDLLALAAHIDCPPCTLLRLVLETTVGLPTKACTAALRDPHTLPDPLPCEVGQGQSVGLSLTRQRLIDDVYRAVAWDHVTSPLVERLKAAAGAKYEQKLESALSALGVPFSTEAALRADGFARTPDVRLEVPIAVCGRLVHWIDSKASFSDPYVHNEKGTPQFQAYVNRYGPGLVIYWFGMVEELANAHPSVMIMCRFPRPEEIVTLPSLHAQQPLSSPSK
jgi:CDAN1-interacting nuclease 1